MDKIREKLVELICGAFDKCLSGVCAKRCEYYDKNAKVTDRNCQYKLFADHLIANGVTVQEWIPVTERLPKPFVSVLVQMPLEEPCPTVREGFITRDGIWHSALYDREPDEVTHWMPMPQPPKGE